MSDSLEGLLSIRTNSTTLDFHGSGKDIVLLVAVSSLCGGQQDVSVEKKMKAAARASASTKSLVTSL